MPGAGAEPALEAARRSGLVRGGEPLLVLLSGGADSVCLLDVAVRLGAVVSALHVNYGLRPDSGADEEHCRELCGGQEVPLAVERVELASASGPGNLQAEAREARYARADRHARGDYAAAHTASDQAETVVYRLAVSPGRRALLGMEPRRGRLVRPLLRATREETRSHCELRGLPWREDASNLDPRFARARIRADVIPALRELNPAAERAIAETSLLLRDEAEVVEEAVGEALGTTTAGGAIPQAELREMGPGLARLVLRRLAEDAAGRPHPISGEDLAAVQDLAASGGSASIDLGGGLRAVAEYGMARFTTGADAPPPDPVELPVPGVARFGDWEVEARREEAGEASREEPDETSRRAPADAPLLAADALGATVTVRAWRAGDRMRPLGLGGTKSLQDLFTDRKVPRALRQSLPLVESSGEIAWVAGVAVGERFRIEGAGEAISISARRPASSSGS